MPICYMRRSCTAGTNCYRFSRNVYRAALARKTVEESGYSTEDLGRLLRAGIIP